MLLSPSKMLSILYHTQPVCFFLRETGFGMLAKLYFGQCCIPGIEFRDNGIRENSLSGNSAFGKMWTHEISLISKNIFSITQLNSCGENTCPLLSRFFAGFIFFVHLFDYATSTLRSFLGLLSINKIAVLHQMHARNR